MNVKISSTSGQSIISDDEDNSVTSSMVHWERHWVATFSIWWQAWPECWFRREPSGIF
jgi:hypothetical protein